MTAPVIVHVNLGSYGQDELLKADVPSGFSVGEKSEQGGSLDPYQAHIEWPSLWAEFLRRAFAGPMMSERIALAFQVSERTARKWLNGQGGCNGRHVRVAVDLDREAAMQTLFHMAAE